MEVWKRNLVILWIGSFITSASFSMVVPFLSLFLTQIGVHTHLALWSGALYSAAFLAGAISSPYWGSLADRYGRKPMIVRAGIVLFIVYLLTAFVTNPYELLGLRLMQGLLSGFIPGAIALVGTNTPEKRVGFALSMISASTSTGAIVGPLLGGIIARIWSNRIAFGSAGILVLFATILVIIWVREDKFVPAAHRSSVIGAFREGLQNRPLLSALLLNMFTAFSIMTVEPIITLYIAQLNHSTNNASLIAGIVFSISGIAGVVFAPVWGRLADKIGFIKILLVGLFGGAIFTFMQLPFHNVWAFAGVRFVYGAFFCAVFPAINGLVVKATTSTFRGRAFGLNQTANQIGNMLGPTIGGFLADALSLHGVFWVTGALLTMAGGVSVLFNRSTLHGPTVTHREST
ncbi:MFS transporter [Alicyclobacillus acidoterrestris]|uniref:MFS transporter n=1 Tax=Alicyclobacillus suci TaxID=2816080 RepID=UPI0011925DAA|nr:MFS transporter [Alicyclobacillus suci]GEO25365.1 MFS transporter [Alicyclobacillus acidoterrestris]